MINALVIATIVATNPAAQKVKAIDIDRFNTPYSVTLNMENSDTHNWYGLSKSQCLFPNRGSNFSIVYNPNQTTVTFTIGNGEQKFTSPLKAAWKFSMDYYTLGGASVDMSAMDRIYVNYHTVPAGQAADVWQLYVEDTQYQGSGTMFDQGQPNGVFFRKEDFLGTVDWRHIRYLSFRQDFHQMPNPTTYNVTRFCMTVKPGTVSPAP